ncbi:METTL6 [Branchiostoma lanceolatum]|uniref:tRNA N(3)-methylcytidine methyltransferase n=1 Tax=Branchiostoma lanceolatum TaxID=7740 RepID=A0A8J9W3S9_BRALA|nr:METTL6 [Branchiostoma lanceolatum]
MEDSSTPTFMEVPFQKKDSVHPRTLTDEDRDRLKKQDDKIVSDFKQQKLEKEAQRNWDLFYKRNSTNFFKDRHWTAREFEELANSQKDAPLVLLEAGCGVGNFLFPLLQENPSLFIHACDFSPRAVQFVKDNPRCAPDRCNAFQCDLTKDDLRANVPAASVDMATLIFVLSALHPDTMPTALENIHRVLKPGGCVLFRDYGLYDHAMFRFAPGHKLADSFYVRQDGTRAYYFSTDELAKLFTAAGFSVVSNEYVLRETVNKKEGLCVPRVFVQGKFVKKTQTGQNHEIPGTEQDENRTSSVDDTEEHSCST